MNNMGHRTIPSELQTAAKRDIGRNWQEWIDALSAITSGLGAKHAALNPFSEVSLAVATTAGWHLELSGLALEHSRDATVPALLRSGYLLVESEEARDDFDDNDEYSEYTALAPGDTFKLPLVRSVADIVSPNIDPSEGVISGYKPLGFGGRNTEFLVAVSADGIWRVSKTGDHFYWSRWDQVLSARLFRKVYFTAGGFGSENVVHAILLTAPQRREQLQPFQFWCKTFALLEEILSVKRGKSDWLSEEDAVIVNRATEDPGLLFGFDRAEFFVLEEKDAARIESAIESLSIRQSPVVSREDVMSKIDAFSELARLGLGQLITEDLRQEDWLVERYECSSCGRLARSKELVDYLFKEMETLSKRLPDEVQIATVIASIAGEEEPGKVRPALLQREFELSYEHSVEVLEFAKRFGFGSDAACVICISRRVSKKEVTNSGFTRDALPPSVRFTVLQRDGFRCRYCGQGTQSNPPVELEVDHIIPVAAGGDNDLSNLVAACVSCNRGKSASSVV